MIPAEIIASSDGRVRLTVLGGYLGSGKTNRLRHQLHAGAFKNALVIVNNAEPEIHASLSEEEEQAPVFSTPIMIDDTIDWTAFSVWLSALLHARGDDVERIKGMVRTPAGRLLIQTVRKIVQAPEVLPGQDDRPDREDNGIVNIGRGYETAALIKSLRYFAVT